MAWLAPHSLGLRILQSFLNMSLEKALLRQSLDDGPLAIKVALVRVCTMLQVHKDALNRFLHRRRGFTFTLWGGSDM